MIDPIRVGIRVLGHPIPQGSKVANHFGNGVRDANAKTLKPWRKAVCEQAQDATRYVETLQGPVRVWLRFTFERPKTHYRSGRNAHRLRETAPLFPFGGTNGGDIDKLTRAILDALTDAEVWRDDALVVDVRARKFYAGEHELALPSEGVDIVVEDLTPQTVVPALVIEGEGEGEAPDVSGAGMAHSQGALL